MNTTQTESDMSEFIVEQGLKSILAQLPEVPFKGKKVLVTGGAGFLGSWICDALVRLGAFVVCLDNLSTGRVENIKHLINQNKFSFVRVDINKWYPKGSFDIVVHGASIPSPEDYMRRPVEAMLPNSLSLFRLLEYARLREAAILHMSTSEVYGDAEVVPTPEEYWGWVNPTGMRSSYDEGKRFGEALCFSFLRQYNVDVRIARIFNSFGPKLDVNCRYARVIPTFIVQALRDEPMTIHGDGLQTRSFLYVTDTITALLKMMLFERCEGEVINIGGSREVTIVELARSIKRLTASNSTLEFQSARPDDPRRRCPDISKARKLINWKPLFSLEAGLSHTINWFRKVILH